LVRDSAEQGCSRTTAAAALADHSSECNTALKLVKCRSVDHLIFAHRRPAPGGGSSRMIADFDLGGGAQTIQQRLQLGEICDHVLRTRGHQAVRICARQPTNRK